MDTCAESHGNRPHPAPLTPPHPLQFTLVSVCPSVCPAHRFVLNSGTVHDAGLSRSAMSVWNSSATSV